MMVMVRDMLSRVLKSIGQLPVPPPVPTPGRFGGGVTFAGHHAYPSNLPQHMSPGVGTYPSYCGA